MKTVIVAFLLATLLVGAAVLAAGGETGEVPTSPQDSACAPFPGATNLLQNPSFEGEYSAYVPPDGHPDCEFGVCNTAQMADGWTPYWRSHDPADPDWIIRMPEYKPAELGVPGPPRVRSGERAQQYFTFYSTHEAGIYQQITVTVGEDYCFSVWGHAWSSTDDDPNSSDGLLEQRIGIDPAGGTDWQSPDVIWGELREQYDVYAQFAVTATAQAEQMTVFAYSRPGWAAKHNDVYWDDASVVQTSGEITVGPAGGFSTIVDVDEPQVLSDTFTVDLPGAPPPTWTVALDPAGTLTPSLSTTGGVSGDSLTFTIDTAAYVTGTYTTTLAITTEPALPGSPFAVPITLIVAPDVYDAYLPIIHKP